jgi:thiamine pyrophosphate-dependent acetolactate synthase large subunit-like protein
MRRSEAIAIVMQHCSNRVFMCANGLISRWAFEYAQDGQAFFMLGSMSLAPSIALGIALLRQKQSLGILDGDGNLLMDISSVVSIGSSPAKDLAHFCLNSGNYESTGGQPSIARPRLFCRLASAAEYDRAEFVATSSELIQFCATLTKPSGRVFCEILINERDDNEPRRVSRTCAEIKDNVMARLRLSEVELDRTVT